MLGPSFGLPECRVAGLSLIHGQISCMRTLAHNWQWSCPGEPFWKQQPCSAVCCTFPSRLGSILPPVLKMPSEQGSLLCSMCVESLWDSSGINKFLKAACYDFFFISACPGYRERNFSPNQAKVTMKMTLQPESSWWPSRSQDTGSAPLCSPRKSVTQVLS